MNRAELLESALAAVNARPKAYGPPERNFDRIALLWSDHTVNRYGAGVGLKFDAVDVACMMALMKIARLEETPDHLDSWTDLAGYAACGAECATGAVIEHSADDAPAPRFKVGDRVLCRGRLGVIVAHDTEDPNRPFGVSVYGDPERYWPPLGEIQAG